MSAAIPKGWSVKSFYQLGRIANGQVDPRAEPYRRMVLVAPDHIESGTGRIAVEYTAEELGAISGKYLVQPNDVIYSKIRPNLQKLALADKACLCSADMYPITAKEGVSPLFLKFVLLSDNFTDFAVSVSARSGMPKINRQEIGAFTIAVPDDPDEQQAIAAALSDADGVVAGLERVIAKKRLIKQGAMQDLLTARRRLPGFSGEWEVKRLGSLGVCLRGVSYDGSADLFETKTPHSIMLLRANNVQNGEIVYSDVQHVRKERVKPVQCLKRGDVLVCMANGSRALVGKAGVFWDGDGSAYTFGAFMGCFRPAAGAAADGYVPFLFQSDEYRNQLSVILSGSAINNLAPSQILGFSFKLPVDYSEQQAIAAVLSDMDAEIQTLESRLAKARAVKEGMMQNLLTGRVRLV